MSDLTEFLLARLAEDEEMANYERDYHKDWPDTPGCDSCRPERALAEVEAKRRIVELHKETTENAPLGGADWRVSHGCVVCVDFHADIDCEQQRYPCPTLRHLASVYADHPDYDEAWRV